DVRLSVDLPVNDTLRFRLTGAQLTRDGHVDRLFDGRDQSDRDQFLGRLVTEWTPASDVTLTLALDGTRAREATVGATALHIYEVNPAPELIPVQFATINNLLLNGANCSPPDPDRFDNTACYNSQ